MVKDHRMTLEAVKSAAPTKLDDWGSLEEEGWEKAWGGSYKAIWMHDDFPVVLKRGRDAVNEVNRIEALKPEARELFAPAVVLDPVLEVSAMQRVIVSDDFTRGDSAAMRLLVKLGEARGFLHRDAKLTNCGYIGMNTLVWIDFGAGS